MQYFTIRRSFLFPLGVLLLQTLFLFVLCLVQGQPLAKTFILGAIILPILGLFLESVFRRTIIDDKKVLVNKLLRSKSFLFSEITSMDTVMVRKRAFLTLSAGEEFLILSNAYAEFPKLVKVLLEKIPESAVSEETRSMAQAPPVKSTDVVSCWLGVLLLAFILYLQLGGSI